MRKRVSQPDVSQAVPGRPSPVRYDSGRLSPGVTATNSNTRISAATLPRQAQAPTPASGNNLGLNSDRLRQAMVQRLRGQGISDERVLNAMAAVPRHMFVDEALASRAYEDAALPIGHSQTISQPWVVARMIAAACEDRTPTRVLEVGAGCGYQAAVLAQFVREVHSIERIRGLYELAREHLRALRLTTRIRLIYGDGTLGLPGVAPFDAIVVAAAGLAIPQALLTQLAPGGRLIAPEGGTNQRLVLIERTGAASWKRTELEAVRFVPLRAGIQS
ncbi:MULTISPECIES: protein-L-isoaspartate(D-aspartate) O-methyltransferase [Achromobacter]|jgi:protein-L-isoaspartate(D-aspartate) O-methyltransferase|uniref:Protein-L-isoaspartate O-methyltransferase n=1 Tax=Achromobacter spanius TaxID=217203 RepID=A0AA42LQY0_9BURK|nr:MULTISPECIES: protein-L-isoaspartate(D-aspartate) O-methyltransferase [Achromobacter]MCS3505933.1 protein-L-isoaspartate(D-aspartate) O-methyltransferase [Achromobacter sp. JUb104]MDH0737869.1 protein-L-isoaspartate(D-aspartate) O-methyltransferase [Achromobacter spanius]